MYEAQANESFFQISTPMGEKKRRLTGSSFVSADRLSIIPQVYNAELDDDELEFEVQCTHRLLYNLEYIRDILVYVA